MKIIVLTFPDSEERLVEDIIAKLSKVAEYEYTHDKQQHHIWTFPGLEIHCREQMVCRDGLPVPLSHYEFFTLCFLAEHPGWVFTKEQIYEAVWKEPGDACGAAVASVICQVRRKLWPENRMGGYIRTVVNSGYKFET